MEETDFNSIIIYGSHYGTTKAYAEKFSEMTVTECKSCRDVKNLSEYKRVIFFGALYAGSILGIEKLATVDIDKTDVIICTVGLADPKVPKNRERLLENLQSQLKKETFDKAKIFHLRGGIDYNFLSLKHRLMMAGLCKYLKCKKESELTPEDKLIIETYNKKIYFVDFKSLDEVKKALE